MVPEATASASGNVADDGFAAETMTPLSHNHGLDRDLVSLKISLLGDSQIGKTSFLVRSIVCCWLELNVGFWLSLWASSFSC